MIEKSPITEAPGYKHPENTYGIFANQEQAEQKSVTIDRLLANTEGQQERTKRVKALFNPENITMEQPQQEAERIGSDFAGIMAEELNQDIAFFDKQDVTETLASIAAEQLKMTKESDGNIVIAADWLSEERVEQAFNQHSSYAARELSSKTGVRFDSLRAFLVEEKILAMDDIDQAAAKLDQAFAIDSSSADAVKGKKQVFNLGEMLKQNDWLMVRDIKDPTHLLSNMPGVIAGEKFVDLAVSKQVSTAELLRVFNQTKEQMLYMLINGTPMEKDLLRAAAYFAKTSWQNATLQKGLVQNRPDRYWGPKVDTMIDTFDGMVATAAKEGEPRAIELAIKDWDQISSAMLYALDKNKSKPQIIVGPLPSGGDTSEAVAS